MTLMVRFSFETIKNPENWIATKRGEIPYWDPSEETIKREITERRVNRNLLYAEDNPSGCYFLPSPDFEKDLTDDEKQAIINNCRIDEDYIEIF